MKNFTRKSFIPLSKSTKVQSTKVQSTKTADINHNLTFCQIFAVHWYITFRSIYTFHR